MKNNWTKSNQIKLNKLNQTKSNYNLIQFKTNETKPIGKKLNKTKSNTINPNWTK